MKYQASVKIKQNGGGWETRNRQNRLRLKYETGLWMHWEAGNNINITKRT
jgi:hypothetical protein